MSLTLEQYIKYLDKRDAPWPAPPIIEIPKAKPHLFRLGQVRVVTWSIYGTLLAISGGELLFEHPQTLIMDLALEKTIREFNMWNSMTRKPGAPVESFKPIYEQLLIQQRMAPGQGEKYPEISIDKLWQALIKRLMQKEYTFDSGFYGSLNEFSAKVAYFFQASLQGITSFPNASFALKYVKTKGLSQGFVANGQCFTLAQLQRCLHKDDPDLNLGNAIDPKLCSLSFEARAKQPSEKLFRNVLSVLASRGIKPDQVLHIGSRVLLDVAPARRLGMRTGLFAGDKASLEATKEQFDKPANRPDILLTDLEQITEVVG